MPKSTLSARLFTQKNASLKGFKVTLTKLHKEIALPRRIILATRRRKRPASAATNRSQKF